MNINFDLKKIFRVQTGLPPMGSRALSPRSKAQGPRSSVGQEAGATTGIALGGFIPERIIEAATTPPSSVLATMDRVNASYLALDARVRGSGVTDPAFLDGWNGDKKAWDDFYKANSSIVTIAARGSQNELRQTEAFRLRLVGWNGALEDITGKPALVPPTGEEKRRGDASSPPWWIVSIGTLAVAGLLGYGGYKAWEYVKSRRTGGQEDRKKRDPGSNAAAVRAILKAPRLPSRVRARTDKNLLRGRDPSVYGGSMDLDRELGLAHEERTRDLDKHGSGDLAFGEEHDAREERDFGAEYDPDPDHDGEE